MPKKQQSKPDNKDTEKIQCHFISNTHWDREWRYSMQRTRHMLVYMMDMLLDILENYPEFSSFHLDSQTVPIHDYIEIRPEKEELVKKLVAEKRLFIGPWFCLPDEFCVSGESLIRNLLLGHKIARQFGHVSKTGYSPFSWGQISQMPQIYKGFGIEFAAFYRGINTLVAPKSEIFWQGADGTKIVASRLGCRPRYNVWYVLQRPAYWNMLDVDERLVPWQNGYGTFKMIDENHHLLEAQYAHPKFTYNKETIVDKAKQAIEEQDKDWTTAHRFWSCGHDSSCPDIREIEMIKDANAALKGTAEVFHGNFSDFQKGVLESVSDDLPTAKGEMRNLYTEGSTSALYGWIISARTDVKQDNFCTERDIISYAEPLAVFSAMLGSAYPKAFIDKAYNWMLQNHGHDSIGGCSRDIISEDMLYRSRQSREISDCVTENALKEIAGSIKIDKDKCPDVAMIAYNPSAFIRSQIIRAYLQVPNDWEGEDIEITDVLDNKVEFDIVGKDDSYYQVVQSPNDCANSFLMSRYQLDLRLEDIPSMGYKTFFVKPAGRKRKKTDSMVAGPTTMENEFICVTVKPNGTLTILDKETGKTYDNQGYFKDSSEIGNPWEHEAVENEQVLSTVEAAANIELIKDTTFETSFEVTIDWKLPKGRSEDEKDRSDELIDHRIINTVSLKQDQRWVEVETKFENKAEDHYLQVCFDSEIDTDKVHVQGQFDVVERLLEKIDYSIFDEAPQPENPMNSFVDLSDGDTGLALLNEGLKAYEVVGDKGKTMCLTLLRCFPLRICVTPLEMTDYSKIDNSSQCLGRHTFRYAVMPHKGNWQQANLWQASEKFNLPMLLAQIAPTEHGTGPLEKSFLELEIENLYVSAVKKSEDGDGWSVRLFNQSDETINNEIRLNGGNANPAKTKSPVKAIKSEFVLAATERKWSSARQVTLEELAIKDLNIDSEGWVDFEISAKQILTIEYLP
ncbi:MAG: hypothetical protein GY845_19725 [Planctomycetes bacterium]|nr:hypothetical protein [Planctomycetota bacterium]